MRVISHDFTYQVLGPPTFLMYNVEEARILAWRARLLANRLYLIPLGQHKCNRDEFCMIETLHTL